MEDGHISLKAAKNAVQKHFDNGGFNGYVDAQKMLGMIYAIPIADVAPVRHGQWMFKCDDQPISNDKVYGCSLCDDKNRRYYEWQLSNYCPNCGAKMEGGQNK